MATQTAIRILVADDHPIVRQGLRALIEAKPDMELAGEAADGIEAAALAHTLRPDVILLDLLMPRLDGISAIGQILSENADARIIVLTSFAEDDNVFPAIRAGAVGYLLKDSSPETLVQAIREVHRGGSFLHPTVARRLMQEFAHPPGLQRAEGSLTERELAVLRLMASGLSNHQIAERMVISERTVSAHVSSILQKLHLANRTEATLYALREGLASLDRSPAGAGTKGATDAGQ